MNRLEPLTQETRSPNSTPADAGVFPARGLATIPTVPAQGPTGTGLAPHRLQRVVSCIETRLAERIQVRELADEIHMSPFHFARMFKLATGHAPHAYITRERMERAKRLLADTELPLVEIASRVGYQTQAHFTGVFHRHVGTTPRVYRMACRAQAARRE